MEKTELQKASDKAGGDALNKFQKQYPKSDSGDLQTFALGWQDAEKYFLPIIENYKIICQLADVPKLIIDNPGVLNFKYQPTAEDIEWANKEIERIRNGK